MVMIQVVSGWDTARQIMLVKEIVPNEALLKKMKRVLWRSAIHTTRKGK
jgi:hypothetical protein